MNIINKYVSKEINKITDRFDKKASQVIEVVHPSSLEKVKQIFSLSGGLARPNKFIVGLSFPNFLNQTTVRSLLGISDFSNDIGIFCHTINPGAKVLNSVDNQIYNNLKVKMPTGYSWTNASLSFYERKDGAIQKIFNEWLDGINNPITNTGRFYNDIIGTIKVDMSDNNGKTYTYIVFDQSWPTTMSVNELSYDNENTILSITVEFSYLYQTTQSHAISELTNAALNITRSDIVDTINDIKKIF